MENNDEKMMTSSDNSAARSSSNSKFVKGNTYFDGGILGYLGICIITFLGSVFSLLIALPWMVCVYERWVCSHTVIDGRRLKFTGTGGSLFGRYIKWFLLCIVTLTIYTIWVSVRMQQWTQEHTFFEDSNKETGSKFTGSVLGNFGRDILVVLVSMVTLGIGSFWMSCYKKRWIYANSTIENTQLNFFGKGLSFFGHTMLWSLLSAVTLGIYSLWLPVNLRKWEVKHIEFEIK